MEEKTILIVEDEEPMRLAMVEKFTAGGFHVLSEEDGVAGLKTALSAKPDLIVLDILMPKMDGISAMKQVRETGGDWGKQVPIVMLTNLSDPESVSASAEYNVYDFLVKTDWRLEEVVALARKKLGLQD